MKNLTLLCIYLSVAISACHKNTIPHYTVSAALKATFGYKVGSYWVYRDSVSGEEDSFYTYVSNFSTENEGDALVDRMGIGLKNYSITAPNDSETWGILLTDSIFLISFQNSNDYVETELDFFLFSFPFIYRGAGSGYDSGAIINISPNFYLNGINYGNTIESFHTNAYHNPDIIYTDYFYISSQAGIVKVIFNHPQSSVYRVLELQRYNIVK